MDLFPPISYYLFFFYIVYLFQNYSIIDSDRWEMERLIMKGRTAWILGLAVFTLGSKPFCNSGSFLKLMVFERENHLIRLDGVRNEIKWYMIINCLL